MFCFLSLVPSDDQIWTRLSCTRAHLTSAHLHIEHDETALARFTLCADGFPGAHFVFCHFNDDARFCERLQLDFGLCEPK